MKSTIILRLVAASTLLISAPMAFAQESEQSHMLQMTRIEVGIGHGSQFREGMKAYLECYEENDGTGHWTVWNNVDGKGNVYHLVSRRDNWAELDTMDEATRACWPTVEEKIAPHMISVENSFARHLPDWSGQSENYNVVRLHQFRVDEGRKFREVVGTMTGIQKDAEYEHMGTWFRVIGSDSAGINYFVVQHYENFAAMDDDRPSAYRAIANAVGEERADELWDTFGDTLRDDNEYSTELLRRVSELSRQADD